MKNLLAAALILVLAGAYGAEPSGPPVSNRIDHDKYGTFEAPSHYTFARGNTKDSFAGTLTRADGFTIHFDIGFLAGQRVDWSGQDKYAIFRLHTVNGSFAYTGIERANGKRTVSTSICDSCERIRRNREGTRTLYQLPPEQREQRSRELGELIATVGRDDVIPANFWADYTDDEDLLEFMLIVNSYVRKVKPK